MKFRNYLQLIFGILTFIPGVYNLRGKLKGSGGTFSARYCYAVWFRHLISIYEKTGKKNFSKIAEIGPGDSIGVGLLALLLGVEKYYAFDVVKFANVEKNLKIFYQLIDLLKAREKVPDYKEFPKINPFLNNYDFPYQIYSNEFLDFCLREERIKKIEYSILNQNIKDSLIYYYNDKDIFNNKVQRDTMDLIFSQATMEHVDDITFHYKSMQKLLKKEGLISHSIDFRCHGYASQWDKHWEYSDLYWKLLRGKRPYLINRMPLSKHLNLIESNNFKVLENQIVKLNSNIVNKNKYKKLKDFQDYDFTASVSYILGEKNS